MVVVVVVVRPWHPCVVVVVVWSDLKHPCVLVVVVVVTPALQPKTTQTNRKIRSKAPLK